MNPDTPHATYGLLHRKRHALEVWANSYPAYSWTRLDFLGPMCVDWSELNGDSSKGLGLAADGQAEGGRRVGSGREKLRLCWRIRWSLPVLRAKEAEVPKKP